MGKAAQYPQASKTVLPPEKRTGKKIPASRQRESGHRVITHVRNTDAVTRGLF
jgi:hypothetical protein